MIFRCMPKIMIESKHTELFLSVISAHKGIIYKIANALYKTVICFRA